MLLYLPYKEYHTRHRKRHLPYKEMSKISRQQNGRHILLGSSTIVLLSTTITLW